MATGLLLLIVAAFILLRTTRGQPRLVNVLLKGKQAAVTAGGNG